MLKIAMAFNDGMVLQRDKKIPVWGCADPGKKVEVIFDGKKKETCAGEDGSWKCELDAHAAGVGYEMIISSGDELIHLKDVCVGEVWIAGGQSNMEYYLGFDKQYEEVLTWEQSPYIRFFDYPRVSYEGELEEFEYKHEGFWRNTDKENLRYFSAVGYFFARNIEKELHVPVGIVGCNWGGTRACAWIDPEKLKGTVSEFWLNDYEKEVEKLNIDEYKEKFKKNPICIKTECSMDNPLMNKIMRDSITQEDLEELVQNFTPDSGIEIPVMGPYNESRPGGLYETMLEKVAPFAARGVIWYQGESDNEKNPEAYENTFSLLIENWRELWNEELPFLFVQLAPFGSWVGQTGDTYPILRQCQENVSKKVSNTWMASIGDVGMNEDIHPKYKKPVGDRLGLLARGHIYGEDILCDAPEIKSVECGNGEIILSFEHGNGLHLSGNHINALSLEMADGSIEDVTDVQIEEDKVVIRAGGKVTRILFAQTGYYEVNLYNESQIPAKPFIINCIK